MVNRIVLLVLSVLSTLSLQAQFALDDVAEDLMGDHKIKGLQIGHGSIKADREGGVVTYADSCRFYLENGEVASKWAVYLVAAYYNGRNTIKQTTNSSSISVGIPERYDWNNYKQIVGPDPEMRYFQGLVACLHGNRLDTMTVLFGVRPPQLRDVVLNYTHINYDDDEDYLFDDDAYLDFFVEVDSEAFDFNKDGAEIAVVHECDTIDSPCVTHFAKVENVGGNLLRFRNPYINELYPFIFIDIKFKYGYVRTKSFCWFDYAKDPKLKEYLKKLMEQYFPNYPNKIETPVQAAAFTFQHGVISLSHAVSAVRVYCANGSVASMERNTATLDISTFPKGMYIVEVTEADRSKWVKKIMK